ncbi:MAG: FeoA family protein [Promethearchaeota archaeon]
MGKKYWKVENKLIVNEYYKLSKIMNEHKRKRKRRRIGKYTKAYKGILENVDVFKKLKRQEEDVLKYIYEKEEKAHEEKLKRKFKNINGNIDEILSQLIYKQYLDKFDDTYILTHAGHEIAELIFRIHNEIEDYIKGTSMKCNAHQMAHVLEHKLTEKEINLIIKASELRDKGRSLNKFNLPSGIIVDVNIQNYKIWTKLISMGIFPGQRIQILNKTGHNFLLRIKGSRIAIDQELAKCIYLIP